MEQVRQILKLISDGGFVEGGALARHRAFAAAGLTLDDLSLIETYDCFTIAELMEYEAMHRTPAGQGRERCWRAGRRPTASCR